MMRQEKMRSRVLKKTLASFMIAGLTCALVPAQAKIITFPSNERTGGDAASYRPGATIKKSVEKGVTVWRPKARVPQPRPRPAKTADGTIPDLAGGQTVVIQKITEVNIFQPNEDFAVGKLRVSGFYSGRGRSTNPVRGFYSGKRRKRPSTVQGFYSGYRHSSRRRFPTERPNGRRAAPLPPGEYAY